MSPLVAAIVTLGTVLAAVIAYGGGRYAVRQSVAANRDGNSAEWERRYRAGAEAHMPWDYQMLANQQQLQGSHNERRIRLGLEPEDFPEIPPPPPLFPQPPSRKD